MRINEREKCSRMFVLSKLRFTISVEITRSIRIIARYRLPVDDIVAQKE